MQQFINKLSFYEGYNICFFVLGAVGLWMNCIALYREMFLLYSFINIHEMDQTMEHNRMNTS